MQEKTLEYRDLYKVLFRYGWISSDLFLLEDKVQFGEYRIKPHSRFFHYGPDLNYIFNHKDVDTLSDDGKIDRLDLDGMTYSKIVEFCDLNSSLISEVDDVLSRKFDPVLDYLVVIWDELNKKLGIILYEGK